ncbi:MAG: hypothetical protein R2780_07980 [Crocinitomicaceae bacterium]
MIDNNLLIRNSGDNGDNSIPLDNNEDKNDMNLLKLEELISKYPELKKDLGWTKEELEAFYEGKLLFGEEKSEGGRSVLYVSEDSLKRLVEYRKLIDNLKNELEKSED